MKKSALRSKKTIKLIEAVTIMLILAMSMTGCGEKNQKQEQEAVAKTENDGSKDSMTLDTSKTVTPKMLSDELTKTWDSEVPAVLLLNITTGEKTFIENGSRHEMTDNHKLIMISPKPINDFTFFPSEIILRGGDIFEFGEGIMHYINGATSTENTINLENEELIFMEETIGDQVYRQSFILTKEGFPETDLVWYDMEEQEIYSGDFGTVSVTHVDNNENSINLNLQARSPEGEKITLEEAGIRCIGFINGIGGSSSHSTHSINNGPWQDEISIDLLALKAAGINKIEDIQLEFAEASGEGSLEDAVWEKADSFSLTTYGAEVSKSEIPGTVIYDANGITVYSSAYLVESYDGSAPEIYFYMENNTNKTIAVDINSIKVKEQELLPQIDGGQAFAAIGLLEAGERYVYNSFIDTELTPADIYSYSVDIGIREKVEIDLRTEWTPIGEESGEVIIIR